MKKIILLLFVFYAARAALAVTQQPPPEENTGVNLQAEIRTDKRDMKRNNKKVRIAREVDSLIINRNFQFKPVAIFTGKSDVLAYIDELKKHRVTTIQSSFIPEPDELADREENQTINMSFNRHITLPSPQSEGKVNLNKLHIKEMLKRHLSVSPDVKSHESIRISNGWIDSRLIHENMPLRRNAGVLTFGDTQLLRSEPQLLTDNIRFAQCLKTEDNMWFMTVEVSKNDEILNYEFVSRSTGWTALRITSNRWNGHIVYVGWLVDT